MEGQWRFPGGNPKKRLQCCPRCPAAIEANDVLVQVARPILRLAPLVRAEQPGLQITEHARDVRRPRVSPFRCADDPHAVRVAGTSRVRVAAPALCADPRPGLAVPSNERAEAVLTRVLDRLAAYPAGPLSGTPFLILLQENFDRASHQGLGLGSRTPLPVLPFEGPPICGSSVSIHPDRRGRSSLIMPRRSRCRRGHAAR